MPRPLAKNLNFCFTKIKTPPSHHSRHPDRPFFSTPTPSSFFPFLKNFNSLYDFTFESRTTNPKSPTSSLASGDVHSSSDTDSDLPCSTPDLTTAFASQRFFFSSPGRSNSIVDSSSSSVFSIASSSSSTSAPAESGNFVDGSVAVPTYSPDPYVDFRRSMQEMVEAHEIIDWDFLQELLMCYLSLNPKSTHKFILGAFADLLVSLMSSSPVTDYGRSDLSD